MSVHYCPFQNGSLPSPKHTPLWRQRACLQEQATTRKCTQGNNRSLLPSSLQVPSSWYFARSCTRGSRRGRGRWEERRGKCGISHQLEGRKGTGGSGGGAGRRPLPPRQVQLRNEQCMESRGRNNSRQGKDEENAGGRRRGVVEAYGMKLLGKAPCFGGTDCEGKSQMHVPG